MCSLLEIYRSFRGTYCLHSGRIACKFLTDYIASHSRIQQSTVTAARITTSSSSTFYPKLWRTHIWIPLLLTLFILADNGNRQRSPHFKPQRVTKRVHIASREPTEYVQVVQFVGMYHGVSGEDSTAIVWLRSPLHARPKRFRTQLSSYC
jgi:hypothetical protein